jgi:DamX protein
MNSAVQTPGDADWFRHYGFDRDPFADGGVFGLFYPGGARQEVVEQLQHLARYSDCVLLVAGVAGSGKSTTRRHFAAQAGADTRCCVVEAALLDGPEQWLRRALAGFGLRTVGTGDLDADLRALAAHCAARSAAGTRCWLVVDDAHDLHEEVVALLPRLLAATAPHLRLVLFAEPRWRGVLHAALPPDVALHTLELQPFDQGETYAYLHYRLNTAGLDGEPPFNGQEFQRIHQQSGGLPGRINTLAREILCSAAGEVQQPLSALPLWHFAVIAVTLIALLLLYTWGTIDQDDHRPSRPQPAAAGKPANGAVPSLQIAPAPAQGESTATLDETESPAGAEPTPESIELAAIAADAATSAPEPVVETPVEPAAEIPAAARDESAAAVEVDEPASAASMQPDDEPAAIAAPPPPVVATPAPLPAEAKPATAVKPADERPPQGVTPDADTGSAGADEAALLAMDSTHYVLQIMGSDDGARVRAFSARSAVPLRLYRKRHNGRDWFALVHGEYATLGAAEAAVAALPESMRTPAPWVRRVDGIQREIRSARTP